MKMPNWVNKLPNANLPDRVGSSEPEPARLLTHLYIDGRSTIKLTAGTLAPLAGGTRKMCAYTKRKTVSSVARSKSFQDD